MIDKESARNLAYDLENMARVGVEYTMGHHWCTECRRTDKEGPLVHTLECLVRTLENAAQMIHDALDGSRPERD